MTAGNGNANAEARRAARSKTHPDGFTHVQLPALPNVPGQISPEEGQYLYWLLSKGYTGAGAVVEIGTWLGLSTIHLAAGLRDSGHAGRLYCFDNYIWGGATDNKKAGFELAVGSDFQPYFEKNIAPFRANIDVFKGDFTEIRWPADRTIEILFLDGPKTAEALSICLKTLRPALVPGETMVVFQDYQHPASFETPLAVQRLAPYLQLCDTIASGGTASFLLTKGFDPAALERSALSTTGMSIVDIKAAWKNLLQPLRGRVLNRMKSGYALHLCELGEVDESKAVLRSLEFDQRLHDGWTNWSKIPRMQKLYQPLFDVYLSELR